jgi:hypothetical protein
MDVKMVTVMHDIEPTQDADASQPPVAMFINSSKLRALGFTLREMIPPAQEAAARGGRRLRQLQGMGPKRFVLSADNDNTFRSRCGLIRGKSRYG